MKTYGLIGKQLTHSFSPSYFTKKFERENIEGAQYKLFPLPEIQQFKQLIAREKLSGLNVTIPYKTSIIPFLDALSDQAKAVGAVNTIEFRDNQLIGHNTDVYGFEQSLRPLLGPRPQNYKALILGTGGASKAVQYVCNNLQIEHQMVSRNVGTNSITYDQIDTNIISQYLLIVNTTPLGMYPNVDSMPALPYEHLSANHILYDLVYNPATTAFMAKGQLKNACVINGLKMLQLQAEKAWEIWQNTVN